MSCMQNGSTIGIDGTFNSGACYVTYMVYQNPKLLGMGRVSLQFFWCVFLRWDGSYATYCTLLSNILASLGVNIDWEKIIFGTNEETVLINAIKQLFQTQSIFCMFDIYRHSQCRIQGLFYLEREQEFLDEFTRSCGSYIINSEI